MRRIGFARVVLPLIVLLGAAGFAWHSVRRQRPDRTANTLIANVAGFPDLDPQGVSCHWTEERAGIGGWRRGASCLRGDRRRSGMSTRDARGRMLSSSSRWYNLEGATAAHLIDSIETAIETRDVRRIPFAEKCPDLVPSNMRIHGAWQGPGFQALVTESWDHDAHHQLQIEVTSTAFWFCGPDPR